MKMASKPIFYTVRKNWKKSIFATCLAFYGAYYASGRFREYLVRREICNEARKIGQEPIGALEKPRRMYVFLNPSANNGKSIKMYEKDVAPILHLAAIDVTLIKTEYEGHPKSIMGYIDPTVDGIIVAGGDGTIMEVVTGFIRLQNQEVISRIPIGILPLGKTNSFFQKTHKDMMQNARTLGKATMAIIKGETKHIDVMEIASEGVRSTYALSSFYWGMFQEVKTKINAKKHWWAGPFKKQMAFMLRTLKNWPHLYSANLTLNDDETEGETANHCVVNDKENDSTLLGEINKEDLAVVKQKFDVKSHDVELDFVDQPHKKNAKKSVSVVPGLHILLSDVGDHSKLHVEIWDKNLTRNEFMSDGFKWIRNNYGAVESGNSEHFLTAQVDVVPQMNELTWYHIDGEEFEARDIKIRIQKNKLLFFQQ